MRPNWATDDSMDQDIVILFKDPRYWLWVESLTDVCKKREAEKFMIIYKGLERIENAIEDELIKRGNIPETTRC